MSIYVHKTDLFFLKLTSLYKCSNSLNIQILPCSQVLRVLQDAQKNKNKSLNLMFLK